MNKKIVLFFVAENHAGKTVIAEQLLDIFPEMAHFSIRAIINEMHRLKYGVAPLAERESIQNFSEHEKSEYGPQIFIEEAVKRFDNSSYDMAIIESVRAEGEVKWIKGEEFKKEFQDIIPLIIGITAPLEDRFNRFMTPRPDNIAKELTYSEFEKHEVLSSSGSEPWEANIQTAILYADVTVNNADGRLNEAVKEIRTFVASVHHAV